MLQIEQECVACELVHALMEEVQSGTPNSALASAVTQRLSTLGAKVMVRLGENPAVVASWGSLEGTGSTQVRADHTVDTQAEISADEVVRRVSDSAAV
jgi:hypothetical protein